MEVSSEALRKFEEELNLFVSSFKNNNFEGFYIKNIPNQKSGQTFLLLKKGE